MVARSIAVMATTALTAANAFLLPPSVSSADIPADIAVVKPTSQLVKLACKDCIKYEEEPAKPLDATLNVEITTMLNGYGVGLPESYALYPPLQSYMKPTITVEAAGKSGPKSLEMRVSADATMMTEELSKDGESLIKIKYSILAIDGQHITVQPIHITAIKAADKTVSILTVIKEDESDKKTKECDMPAFICQFHNLFNEGVSKLKNHLPELPGLRPGCVDGPGRAGRVLPGHIRPQFRPIETADEPIPGPPHGSPHHGGPRFGHRRPHFRHQQWNIFVRILKTVTIILVPIFLGITMGIFVSFIGMIVGRLVVFLWTRFARGGKRGYASVRLNEDDAEADEAKPGDDVESVGEAPPMYEDVPEYTEKASS